MRVEAAGRLRVRTDYFEHRSVVEAIRRRMTGLREALGGRRRVLSHAVILVIAVSAAAAAPWVSG